MACHEVLSCPRCGDSFECKPGNVTACQCFGISFNEDEKAFVRDRFSGCLCRNCLLAIKQEVKYQITAERLARMQALIKYQ